MRIAGRDELCKDGVNETSKLQKPYDFDLFDLFDSPSIGMARGRARTTFFVLPFSNTGRSFCLNTSELDPALDWQLCPSRNVRVAAWNCCESVAFSKACDDL